MICAVCNKPIEGVSYTVVTEEYYLDCVCENCASFADDLGADVEENKPAAIPPKTIRSETE
jgi:ribosome-binding protein aMBF1 (putative translation factor)